MAALAALILVLELADGARHGQQNWRSVLGWVGMVLLSLANLAPPPRRVLSHALLASGLAFVAASLLLRLGR